MHHFAHRGGVLHAEDVPVPAIAAAVGTPFYCYSTATLTAPLPGLQRGVRRPRPPDLLFAEGELQPGGDRDPRQARRRRRRGVGGGAAARACRRSSARENRLLGRRQDGAGARLRTRLWYPLLQRRVRAGARSARPPCRSARCRGAGLHPHQPRRRCEDARKDLHRPQGEQVRRALQPRAGALRTRREYAGYQTSSASTRISAASSPSLLRSTTRSG